VETIKAGGTRAEAVTAPPQRLGNGSGPLRILVENSEYWLRNNGDLAMLTVTLDRLHQRWPDARIAVLTDSPCLLRAYFPGAEGISVFDQDPWAPPTMLERLAGRLGPRVVGPIALARLRLNVRRKQVPAKVRAGRRKLLRMALGRPALAPARETAPLPTGPLHPGSAAAAAQSSLVLALGGGYLTDADRHQTIRVLNLVEHACDAGVPVAFVGQGLGPLEDPGLQARAAQVLPKVGLIALREDRRGPQILERAGVAADRVLVTGDDAIELAYQARAGELGSDIGFCLRIAGYSPVSTGVADLVGQVVRAAASGHAATLVPLIIAEFRSQDRRSTLPLVRGAADVVAPPRRYVHPIEVARRVARCRVLVTGAYHLAVFALSQGIPVVALTSSAYYDDKFLGLGAMFGQGLTLVRLDGPDLEQTLTAAIDQAWRTAPDVREPLRAQARVQIDASRAGFDRLANLAGAAATVSTASAHDDLAAEAGGARAGTNLPI
jgi:polysaccharide pyruvyl transferase WcaK-like protein